MVTLAKLTSANFKDFLNLLVERGEAPEDYYRWKYLDQPSNGKPTGFIAYLDDQPVGCIGIINRTYQAIDHQENSASWFADWFLTEKSRGKGIGKLLMENVRRSASYNFGIPGPTTAQRVCLSAGYKPMPQAYDTILYLQPFRCGYYRGNGSYLKRYLRGLKNVLTSLPVTFKFGFKEPAIFNRHERFNYNKIIEASQISGEVSQSLQRNEAFVNWISSMPISENSKRFWWTIRGSDFFCWGFSEKDFWGLNKAQIFEIISVRNKEDYISIICKTLVEQSMDFIKYVSESCNHHSNAIYQYPLPIYYCGPELPNKFYLSSLDKESSWREFILK